MFLATGRNAPAFCEWVRALGGQAAVADQTIPPGARLIHLEAPDLFAAATEEAPRQVLEQIRRQGGLISVDLGGVEWIREVGGSRTAYQMATLRPDVLFAVDEAAAQLGAPLEGMAAVPVVTVVGRGCIVHGRRLPAPEGVAQDPAGFMAAFCVALLDGSVPVEAAGRALLAAAGRLQPQTDAAASEQ